jgi:hypothetical protein
MPLHVLAQSAEIEQIAGNVFELVAGKGNLEPCEGKENHETCPPACGRRAWIQLTSFPHCRHLPGPLPETWLQNGTLYNDSRA